MARMWVHTLLRSPRRSKMMFANAGVIYKALGIPVNSFTVMFAMGFRFFEAKKAGGLSLSR